MAKQRTHEVRAKNKKSATHCGTISAEDIRKMDNANRRKERIASGINPSSGSGIHGGGKKERNRKDRRESRQQTRDLD